MDDPRRRPRRPRPPRRKPIVPRDPRPVAEALEPRALLSAVTAVVKGGELRIIGDANAANDVKLTLDAGGRIVATVNQTVRQVVARSAISGIVILTGAKNDRVDVSPFITTPARITTLAGDDTVSGGGGRDTITGGPGRDTIDPRGGRDLVWAGDGDDTVRAGSDDEVYGGRGRDRIVGTTDRSPAALDAPVPPVTQPSAPPPPPASQPAGGLPVKAYAWSPVANGGDVVAPMVWVSAADEPAAVAARRVAPLLAARPIGDRTLFLFAMMSRAFTGDPVRLVRDGPDLDRYRDYSRTLFQRLRAAGAPVDRIVLDYEGGMSVWHLFAGTGDDAAGRAKRVAVMRRIYQDPAAAARLPAELKQFKPEDFAAPGQGKGRAAYLTWNRWAQQQRADAIRRAVADPAAEARGRAVPVSNYGDVATTFAAADVNGWPVGGPLPTTVSSPEVYLWTGNAQHGLKKDPRWNRLIQSLNLVRSAMARDDAALEPWVSFPGFRGERAKVTSNPWLWEQLIRHMAATGVTTFYYWNPAPGPRDPYGRTKDSAARDDAFAAQLFRELSGRPAPAARRDLPPIPADADEIVTGGVRTTYAEFMDRFASKS